MPCLRREAVQTGRVTNWACPILSARDPIPRPTLPENTQWGGRDSGYPPPSPPPHALLHPLPPSRLPVDAPREATRCRVGEGSRRGGRPPPPPLLLSQSAHLAKHVTRTGRGRAAAWRGGGAGREYRRQGAARDRRLPAAGLPSPQQVRGAAPLYKKAARPPHQPAEHVEHAHTRQTPAAKSTTSPITNILFSRHERCFPF